MPAAAVASFTPAISGISGTSVGARGETVVDIGASGFEAREALCITFIVRTGEALPVAPAHAGAHTPRLLSRAPWTTALFQQPTLVVDGVDGPLRHQLCQNEVVTNL